MTIKEVEQLLGITKTSLLYYEKEGMIQPDRKDNNDRNYNDKEWRQFINKDSICFHSMIYM